MTNLSHPLTEEEKYYSEFKTAFVSYGLSEKDKNLINNYLNTMNKKLENNPLIPELKHVVCSTWYEFSEMESCIIAINFSSITYEEDFDIFNDCYKDTDTIILATDKFPIDNSFSYYPNFDFTDVWTLDKIIYDTIIIKTLQ